MSHSTFLGFKAHESLVLAAQTTKLEKFKAALKNQKIKSDEFLLNKSTSFHVES